MYLGITSKCRILNDYLGLAWDNGEGKGWGGVEG